MENSVISKFNECIFVMSDSSLTYFDYISLFYGIRIHIMKNDEDKKLTNEGIIIFKSQTNNILYVLNITFDYSYYIEGDYYIFI